MVQTDSLYGSVTKMNSPTDLKPQSSVLTSVTVWGKVGVSVWKPIITNINLYNELSRIAAWVKKASVDFFLLKKGPGGLKQQLKRSLSVCPKSSRKSSSG